MLFSKLLFKVLLKAVATVKTNVIITLPRPNIIIIFQRKRQNHLKALSRHTSHHLCGSTSKECCHAWTNTIRKTPRHERSLPLASQSSSEPFGPSVHLAFHRCQRVISSPSLNSWSNDWPLVQSQHGAGLVNHLIHFIGIGAWLGTISP